MKQDEIIEMAKQAGMGFNQSLAEFSTPLCDGVEIEELEAFAKLVAAKEREEFAVHAVDIARRAVAEEREACAKLCERLGQPHEMQSMAESIWTETSAKTFADAIRARGEA